MNLLERLADGPLLCDGGMGTQLMALGLEVGTNSALWNAENPEAVRSVHARYREAGCDLITTNTFQGTRAALDQHGLGDRVAELNKAGAQVAKEAASVADAKGAGGFVLADAGPFGGFLEPLGDVSEGEAIDLFLEQFTALRAGGADVALIETMSDPGEVAAAIQAARQVGAASDAASGEAGWPLVVTYAFQKAGAGFATMMGTTAEATVKSSLDAGADVVGANCGTGLELDDYLRLAEALVAAAGGAPVILQPNAGAPQQGPDGMVWPAGPDDMAAMVPKLHNTGVRIIGGCCGTTPEHLAAMRGAMV